MAIADADYKFIAVEVGANGSEVDSTVFRNWEVGNKIITNQLPLPEDVTIGTIKIPFYFVADNAFPSTRNKTLEADEKAFNYRLSRARRCVENAFGILTAKWRCLRRQLECEPESAKSIALACVILHNYLMKTDKKIYCPKSFEDHYENGVLIEGEWRNSSGCLLESDDEPMEIDSNISSHFIRDKIKNYVTSAYGRLPWEKELLQM